MDKDLFENELKKLIPEILGKLPEAEIIAFSMKNEDGIKVEWKLKHRKGGVVTIIAEGAP